MWADAPCTQADPELFDATNWLDAMRALEYCAACPLTVGCLNARERFDPGVWGGRVFAPSGREVKAPKSIAQAMRDRRRKRAA